MDISFLTNVCVLLQDISQTLVSDCGIHRAINVDDCLRLLTNYNVEKSHIFLIISGKFLNFARHVSCEAVPQLRHIYVLGKLPHGEQIMVDQRFCGIFDDFHQLITTLDRDIEEARRYPATGHQYVTEDNAIFIWYRFFFNILSHLQHTNIAKREMIARARRLCNDARRHAEVDKFEREYRP
jgi:hypothetical protein